MKRALDLCRPCACKLADAGIKTAPLRHEASRKITCTECGRRRYGTAYLADMPFVERIKRAAPARERRKRQKMDCISILEEQEAKVNGKRENYQL